MISGLIEPNKNNLSKTISKMKNPTIKVIEVFDRSDRSTVLREFDKLISKGHFSVILIKD
jgi:hypothetical protein